jgi:hypothetical protein
MGTASSEEPAMDLDIVAREARRASVVYLTQPFDYSATNGRREDHD